jgi:hypothetical protein
VSGRDGVVSVDHTPTRGSRRSNPATYTGLLDPIRKAFAKANGMTPALFSANSEGAWPTCNGTGVIYTDLAMMAGVATTCEECEGKRFQASVLDHHPAHAVPAAARKLCADGLARPEAVDHDPCPQVLGAAALHTALKRYKNACCCMPG